MKERIIETASRLFFQKGYSATSISDITRELGVTKGALYHHFKNKDDIYHEVISNFFQYKSPEEKLGTEQAETFQEFIKCQFDHILISHNYIVKKMRSSEDNAILQFYSFLYEATRRFPEFQEQMDKYDEQKFSMLTKHIQEAQDQGVIRKDIDPEITAIELDAIIQHSVYMSFVNPKIKSNPEIFTRIFENFWRRLQPA
jgi:AcrR family transcriptional regulator